MNEEQPKGTAKDMGGTVEGAARDVTTNTNTQGGVRHETGAVQDLVGEVTQVARDVAEDASAALARAFEAGARYYGKGTRELERRIEDNALLAVLAAGAAGYALAWLIHGRR